jgi:hypothetical protein
MTDNFPIDGPGFKALSYKALRTDKVTKVVQYIGKVLKDPRNDGYYLIHHHVEGQMGKRNNTLINFLASCPRA